jgi:carbamate kinase
MDASPVLRSLPVEVLLAVNGTLMRGLALNQNLLGAGAAFVRETTTAPVYRLWSIGDRHPAMLRVRDGGVAVAVEVWSVPAEGLASILLAEPPGLSIGKVTLADGDEVLGVLGEPILCEGQREITRHGGWRAYRAARGGQR